MFFQALRDVLDWLALASIAGADWISARWKALLQLSGLEILEMFKPMS